MSTSHAILRLAIAAIASLPGSAQDAPEAATPQVPPKASPSPIWDLLPDRPAATRTAAFEALVARNDERDLAPLGDLLRFNQDPDEWFVLLDALQPFFEINLRQQRGVWGLVTTETARRLRAEPTLRAWPDYATWKGDLLGQLVDPRFRGFFENADSSRIRLEEAVWGGVEVDGIPSLDDAPRAKASDVKFLRDTEAVFGVAWGGEALAFPLRVLDWHEMANDQLAGVPFSLSYCTLCGAAVAYATAREGQAPYRFGSSGLLMRSNKLMFDRETETLWNQLTGEPVQGALAGSKQRLQVLPVVATTWGAWKARHPKTESVTLQTGVDRDYAPGASYGRYFASEHAMFPAVGEGATSLDGEVVADKEQLFVVRTRGQQAATVRVSDVLDADGAVLNVALEDGSAVVVMADVPRPRPLPEVWQGWLKQEGLVVVEDCAALTVETALALLRDSECFAAMTAQDLLAMKPSTRFAVFRVFSPDDETAPHSMPRTMRDAVAVDALATSVRAYAVTDRGPLRRHAASGNTLVDAEGVEWTEGEAGLESVGRSDVLARLPGHLVFGLGWRAFMAGNAR